MSCEDRVVGRHKKPAEHPQPSDHTSQHKPGHELRQKCHGHSSKQQLTMATYLKAGGHLLKKHSVLPAVYQHEAIRVLQTLQEGLPAVPSNVDVLASRPAT
jgi:hypothetical protein